jgi:uncharacterized membrane protein
MKTLSLPLFFTLMFVVLFGTGLRLYHFDHLSLWYDELYSLTITSNGFEYFIDEVMLDINPPLYYFLLLGWIKIFGNSPASGRLLSVLISSIAIPVVFLLARRVAGNTVGLGTAILISVSAGSILYAQEVRSYSLLILLTSASFFLWLEMIQCIDNGIPMRLFLFFISVSILAIFTHNFGFFFVNLLWCYLIIVSLFKYVNERKKIFFGFFFINLLYLPLVLNLVFNVSLTNAGNWVPFPNLGIYYHFYTYLFYVLSYKKIPIQLIFLLILIAPLLFDLKRLKKEVGKKDILYQKVIPTVYIIFSLILVTFLFSLIRPIVTSRNLLVLLAPIYFLIAYFFSLTRIYSGKKSVLLITFLSILMILSFSKYYYKSFKKEEWREATFYATEIAREKGIIFTYYLPTYIDYYLKVMNHKGSSIKIGYSEGELLGLLSEAKSNKIKDIVFIESVWDSSEKVKYEEQLKNLDILKSFSAKLTIRKFLGLQVYHYTLK